MRPLCALLLLVAALTSHAQETIDTLSATGTSPLSSITVTTNLEGAKVFVDGDSVGVTPLTLQTTPGMHRIKIVSPDVSSWLSDPIVDSISVAPDSLHSLRYSFPEKFVLLSTPSGAEVVAGDSVVGITPFVVREKSPFVLRLNGHEETPLDFANAQRGILSTHLKKVWQSEAGETTFKDPEESRSPLKLYIAGAATIIAGATSAYFKVRADKAYSEYIETGVPSQLNEVNRLDTAAGIALAATQISLGLFTYFILSD